MFFCELLTIAVCKKISILMDKYGLMSYIYLMNKTISVMRQSDTKNSGYVPGKMSERIAMVWPLTCEVVSVSNKYNVEQRLQRHITCFKRQKN